MAQAVLAATKRSLVGWPCQHLLTGKDKHVSRALPHLLTFICVPQAVLAATKRSLAALRKRLGGALGDGVFFLERPFFNVSLQLAVPHVICSPSLGDIQGAINAAAKKVGPIGFLLGLGLRTRWTLQQGSPCSVALSVTCSPSLGEIQGAINAAAKKVGHRV